MPNPTEISITFTVEHDNRCVKLERENTYYRIYCYAPDGTARTEIYMNLDLELHIFWLRVAETFPQVGFHNVPTSS